MSFYITLSCLSSTHTNNGRVTASVIETGYRAVEREGEGGLFEVCENRRKMEVKGPRLAVGGRGHVPVYTHYIAVKALNAGSLCVLDDVIMLSYHIIKSV